MTKKQRQITTICTATGILLLLIAVIALVYNLISLAVLNGRRAELEQKSAELQRIIDGNEVEIEYRNTAEYIEKYAREYLNMKYEDEGVWEAE